MDQLLWDGDMDMGWEDLTQRIKQVVLLFTQESLDCAKYSANQTVQNLLNVNSMNRFNAVADALTTDLDDSFYYVIEDLESDGSVNSLKIKSWIMLGSAVETALQVFLSVYLYDYTNANWQQWENFETDKAKEVIFKSINDLVENKVIEAAHGRSIKEAIKEEIKAHIKNHPIERIMLDELLQFYGKNNILDQDDIEMLKNVQANRNCIHAYMDRDIGTWRDLQYAARFFVYLLEKLMNSYPDLDDMRTAEAEASSYCNG